MEIVGKREAAKAGTAAALIFPQAVLDDVDAATHRMSRGALADKEASVTDTAASDSHDPFDRGVLLRHMEFRDSHARERLSALLSDPAPDAAVWDDWRAMADGWDRLPLRYVFASDPGGSILRSATSHLHRFLVRGVLLDWYMEAGIETEITEAELELLLDEVRGMLMPAHVPTPLHPFDPKR